MNKTRLMILILMSVSIWIFVSCNKNSNELVEPEKATSYDKILSYNGSTYLTVQVIQKTRIGEDSLKLKITNPYSYTLTGVKAVIYFQEKDDFDNALNLRTEFAINNLGPAKDTTITIFNKPSLPVSESKLFIKLLKKDSVAIHSHSYSGAYDGQAAYYFDTTSTPTNYSFLKGLIEADGNCTFWLKLNDEDKKVTGQFIDTLSLNALYIKGFNQFTAQLDSIAPTSYFINTGNTVVFRIKISPIQANLEQKIKFTLYN